MCDPISGLCKQAVCLEDFCGSITWPGNHGDVSFWADWCPVNKMVYFGGAWGMVPSLPMETMPSDIEQLWPHIEAHGGFWFRDEQTYFDVVVRGARPWENL